MSDQRNQDEAELNTPPAPRVIIHMGFPKTGTTSAQVLLRAYNKRFPRRQSLYLKRHMMPLWEAAGNYARRPSLLMRFRFRRAARAFFSDVNTARPVIISCEKLSGIMPGSVRYGLRKTGLFSYIARNLAKVIAQEARRAFGKDADVTLAYSLRDQEKWLVSAWGHQVRDSQMTLDCDAFLEQTKGMPSLSAIVAQIADENPQVKVTSWQLDDVKNGRGGTASPILSLAGVHVPPWFGREVAQSQLGKRYIGAKEDELAAFLAINRDAKRAQEAQARKKTWLAARKADGEG